MRVPGLLLFCAAHLAAGLTPVPHGPFRIAGNRILDASGRSFLARGTELPALTLDAAAILGNGNEFGTFSPSSFVSIRQRLNMNAVRLPLDPQQFIDSGAYRQRATEVVTSANHFELLVILSAASPASASFWTHCAAAFRDFPNIFFAADTPDPVNAIRSAGATQPIVIPAAATSPIDPSVVYSVAPRYATTHTPADLDAQFAPASRVPFMAFDMDPQLDQDSPECAAFPHDPGAATALLQQSLDYFDSHAISWILSSYRPGRMVTEYRYFNWSKLDDGWTCGESPSHSGIAMVLGSHLWGVDPHGLFPVNHVNGGMVLAPGGLATAYGPILADREAWAPPGRPLPTRLANISVRVIDSRGAARLAPLQYTGAGWSNITFLVPAATAPGSAEIAIVRTDGSKVAAQVTIAAVAPGFFSASADARGAAVGEVVQQSTASGETRHFSPSECRGYDCHTVPIHLSRDLHTTVRLAGSGFRHAEPNSEVRVTVGGKPVHVLSLGPADDTGRDQVTIELPSEFSFLGETDVTMTVDGHLSNVVRLNCGVVGQASRPVQGRQ